MGRELYLECCSGLSCEMILDVLLNLGISADELETRMVQFAQNQEGTVNFEQAEKLIVQSDINPDIKRKLVETLKIILGAQEMNTADGSAEKVIPMDDAENSFRNLAAMGIAMEMLGFSELKISAISEGTGNAGDLVSSEILGVLQEYKLPVHFIENKGEMLTLNSIGFLAAFSKERGFSERRYIERTAFSKKNSSGDLDNETGFLRAMILKTEKDDFVSGEKRDTVQILETNVDDCSGEQLGYAIECLMKAGALDASCFPIYMKKQRPAYMLQVICKKEKQELLEDIIFRETTSIGLRRYEEKRRILPRTFQEVQLKDGHKVKIKICEHHGQKFYYPEYETVKLVCEETGRPYRNVYDEAAALAGGFYDNI